MDLTTIVGEVRSVVREVASRIEEIRSQPIAPDVKEDQSPVTKADHEADALLRSRLTELLPVGWLSEETADAPNRLSERLVWVVDPLDGTKEFIKGIPEYSVAVALVEEGSPILGVVHNPATGETFWGAKGLGAHRGEERMSVQEGDTLLASRSEMKRGEFEPFVRDWNVIPRGSIELKLAHIAAGLGAVTFSRGPKHEWDVCAGALLVEEAGGRVTDLFGEPLRFNQAFPKTRGILAGAPRAFEAALDRIREVGASDRMLELEEGGGRRE
jgi:myo-inositol-1(or 4)-monophosphatase